MLVKLLLLYLPLILCASSFVASSCPGVCNVWTPQWPNRCDNNYCDSRCRSGGYRIGGCRDSFTCCCYPLTCDQVCYAWDPQYGLQTCANYYCNSACTSRGFKMGGCSDSLKCCCHG
ncbi:hypothetical protein AAVH_19821 [Aphelenchoides avenae]|nr:hypothetical protein AAVH_19821 [Aphelenchus avenae]